MPARTAGSPTLVTSPARPASPARWPARSTISRWPASSRRRCATFHSAAPTWPRLLEGFDEQFAAASATGRAALFTAACDGVGAVARLPLLLLDVPMESAVEFNLAKQLIAAAPETLITVPFGDLATLDYLETLNVSIETLVPSGDSDLSALRRSLFAARQPHRT